MRKAKIQLKHGFTFLELLISMAIFSMVSVMAYGSLQTVISTKQTTQKNADRIAEIQLLMLRISNDLRQAVPRKIRDEYGDFSYAMQSGKNSDETLRWSRAGYRNPAQLTRSNIQRVAYKLEQKKLIRMTWPVLDRAQDSKVMETEVLSNIDAIEWRYLNFKNEWLSSWPEEDENAGLYALPKAVELTLELQDWGKVKRLLLVADDA